MWLAGLIVCLGWIFSLCFHEFSHALVAYWGGDVTVKDKGYLTFNPLKYTQPGLSLIMPLVFILIGGIGLPGGAVYINNHLLRSRWWSSFVSAAGPFSNVLSTFFLLIPFWLIDWTEINKNSILNNYDSDILINIVFPSLSYLIYIEISAIIFNLLPIPPFDGYGIIRPWLSDEINNKFNKYSSYSYYFVFGLFWFVPKFGLFFFGMVKNIADLLGISDRVIFEGRELFDQPINKLMSIIIIALVAYLLRFNENTWHQKGNSYASKKQDDKALEAYNKAIKIKPNYTDAWLEKGDSLFRLKRYQEAAESYKKAIDLDPNSDRAWLNLGHVYWNSGDDEEAAKSYKKVIDINPNNYQAWFNLGHFSCNAENYEEAVTAYKKVIDINPNNYQALLNLGYVSCNTGDYEEAVTAYQKIIDLEPTENIEQNFGNLSHALSYLNRETEAIKALEAGINNNPQEPNLWIVKARYLYNLKKYQDAIDCCEEAIKIHTQNTKLWYYLGVSLQELEKYETAKDVFKKIFTFDSQSILALSGQAHLYYIQQNYQAAINNYQKITEIEPNNDNAWYNMACCYALQKNSQNAIASLKKAININPKKNQELAQQDEDFAFLESDKNFQNLFNK